MILSHSFFKQQVKQNTTQVEGTHPFSLGGINVLRGYHNLFIVGLPKEREKSLMANKPQNETIREFSRPHTPIKSEGIPSS